MAMVVQHNAAAQLALGELNKNNDKLRKSLEKVSSGQKINSAKDDSASFCISEKMREQIRTLLQDNQNVQNGSSLFKIADGAINNIVEELRSLKELAINAANDTNNDVDRATIQKEFTQKMANINDIATETNYNGKRLLDGTYEKNTIIGTDVRHLSEIIGYETKSVTIPAGTYTVERVTYNTKAIRKENDVVGLIDNFAAISPEADRVSNPTSAGRIECDFGFEFRSSTWNWAKEMSDTGVMDSYVFSGATPTKYNGMAVNMNFDLSSISSLSLSEQLNKLDDDGFSLLCGGCRQYINIVFDSSKNNSESVYTVSSTDSKKKDYVIGIKDLTSVTADSLSEAIFFGVQVSHTNAASSSNGFSTYDVYLESKADGTKSLASTLVDAWSGGDYIDPIRVEQNPYYDPSDSSKGTKYILTKCKDNGVGAAPFYFTAEPVIEVISERQVIEETFTTPERTEVMEIPIYLNTEEQIPVYGLNDKPLVIHHGPKANLKTHFFISNMHTKFLGSNDIYIQDAALPPYDRIRNQQDKERYNALSYDKKLQGDWLETLKLANNKNLDDISVTTQKNANVAIRVLDGAIERALDEAVQMGAYLQRLEYTGANVTTMGENVQSAESVIRDADMAKEMTEYTKYNVLTQSAQSMLAQANQNGSAVLSLLQ